MDLVAALFIDDIEVRQVAGPSTRIDLTGIQFSAVAAEPVPFTWAPHLVVIVRCGPDEPGTAVLEVTFHRGGAQVARNVQPLQVEPGKFSYRLVRAELELDDYGTLEARCRVDDSPTVVVPHTLLPPVAD